MLAADRHKTDLQLLEVFGVRILTATKQAARMVHALRRRGGDLTSFSSRLIGLHLAGNTLDIASSTYLCICLGH